MILTCHARGVTYEIADDYVPLNWNSVGRCAGRCFQVARGCAGRFIINRPLINVVSLKPVCLSPSHTTRPVFAREFTHNRVKILWLSACITSIPIFNSSRTNEAIQREYNRLIAYRSMAVEKKKRKYTEGHQCGWNRYRGLIIIAKLSGYY